MGKMSTVRKFAYGKLEWNERDEARIERNLFAIDGKTWEALRFCKYRDGRHNRVHLVIDEDDFVELFRDAVRKGVFHVDTMDQMRTILEGRETTGQHASGRDPVLSVVGVAEDGNLAQGIEEELYGDERN